ncbi:MAG: hypothetical protein BWY68_00595 [bacterium ADurb.Bin400]|nr:MAG: hypothetical protein BWY68_00595 [bacterium ADurb.Bin400]
MHRVLTITVTLTLLLTAGTKQAQAQSEDTWRLARNAFTALGLYGLISDQDTPAIIGGAGALVAQNQLERARAASQPTYGYYPEASYPYYPQHSYHQPDYRPPQYSAACPQYPTQVRHYTPPQTINYYQYRSTQIVNVNIYPVQPPPCPPITVRRYNW